MAKFQEHHVRLGDWRYGAPSVIVRRVDFNFGQLSIRDPRVLPYLDVDLPAKVDGDPADMILHCVDHDVLANGVSWNSSASAAERPDSWCSGCARLKAEHAPIDAERAAAAQAAQRVGTSWPR
ncbi:hypothetical protein [Nocardiopsis rhodophaea]|uniref:hypothetical protein n=1 Tax=Nocardiopsis rhodophaea TaxID=280238 RepID=UPI0031D5D31C